MSLSGLNGKRIFTIFKNAPETGLEFFTVQDS